MPVVLPAVVRWAEARQAEVLRDGVPLNDEELATAKRMGVKDPYKIRLLRVVQVPMPGGPVLGTLSRLAGFNSATTAGMCVGYGVYVRHDNWRSAHLVAHECVHTAQYERLGGMRPFLSAYVRECLKYGYLGAPLEQEAVEKSTELFL